MELQDQQTKVKGWRRFVRRPSPASLVSVVAHVILGVMVWNAIQMPAVFDRFFPVVRTTQPVVEKIQFVTVTPPLTVANAPPRSATRQAPVATRPSAPIEAVPLTSPTEIPREIPPPAATPDTIVTNAVRGPLRGGNGPTRGVQPNYDDPRLWVSDLEFFYAPKTDIERLDSALYATLKEHMDSIRTNTYTPNKFEKGDWTFGKDGSKWGVDQQYIRLGRFSIPTALLALLPLNRMQGNPIAMERDRNAAYMRADIQYHAQAAMNEAQFRKAVQQIRDRKEREKRARVTAKSPETGVAPGERPPPNN